MAPRRFFDFILSCWICAQLEYSSRVVCHEVQAPPYGRRDARCPRQTTSLYVELYLLARVER